MNSEKQNVLIYYLQYAAYNIAIVLSTGAVIQTFMLECGISNERVSLYVSALQIIQTVMMLLISKASENIKNIRKGVTMTYSAYIPFFAVLLFLCIKNDFLPDTKFIIIFAFSILLNIFLGVYNIIFYKLPYEVMDIRNYGKVSGQGGVIAGLVCMAFSAILTYFGGRFSYFGTMAVFFAVGIVTALWMIFANVLYKPMNNEKCEEKSEKINIFKYKPFYQLIIPNFARGFSLGIFNLITVIGYSCRIIDSSSAGIIATVMQIATLISCQTYAIIVRKCKNGNIIVLASVVFCIAAPMITLFAKAPLFYLFYFIAYFFINFIAYAVPVLVATHIEYSVLSQYTAWRMALFTLGTAIGSAVVPFLLNTLGSTGTLIVSGITILPCGIGYYFFERKCKK
ncbi:MAG: hypothetical protein IJM97_02265 [Clostridia bacterium]|nr:hypothetical protein [Clostridia bacterium]